MSAESIVPAAHGNAVVKICVSCVRKLSNFDIVIGIWIAQRYDVVSRSVADGLCGTPRECKARDPYACY